MMIRDLVAIDMSAIEATAAGVEVYKKNIDEEAKNGIALLWFDITDKRTFYVNPYYLRMRSWK